MGEAMDNKINRAIQLLLEDQPVYYVGAHTGQEISYKAGLNAAQTWADYINIGFEHGAFDILGLGEFMRGLVDGGPTRSGHRTPAVIVEAPVDGESEQTIRANSWQFRQILARGVHGIILCHAETPGAIRAFVESCRFPFQKLGLDSGLGQGRRGSGGQASAAAIWGISDEEYLKIADPWPLNPKGELLLGLKFENSRTLTTIKESVAIPGIAYAEYGPGDQALSLGYSALQTEPFPQNMLEIRDLVFNSCRSAGITLLDITNRDSVIKKIDEGIRIFDATKDQEIARTGRDYTNRKMLV